MGNKTVFITGGTSGIGMACAGLMAREGYNVFVVGRREKNLEDTLHYLSQINRNISGMAGDISLPGVAEDAVRRAMKTFGGIHYAINSAGVESMPAPVGELSDDGWFNCINVNLSGVFFSCRAEINAMLDTGDDKCALVNVASISGINGMPATPAYVAAKWGVVGLTKNIAIDYSRRGIRCNAVAPGYIRTPMLERAMDSSSGAVKMRVTWLKNGNLMERIGDAGEVARVIRFLLSEDASYISGAVIPVDGGWSAY